MVMVLKVFWSLSRPGAAICPHAEVKKQVLEKNGFHSCPTNADLPAGIYLWWG
jgi:hypothetical protein